MYFLYFPIIFIHHVVQSFHTIITYHFPIFKMNGPTTPISSPGVPCCLRQAVEVRRCGGAGALDDAVTALEIQ